MSYNTLSHGEARAAAEILRHRNSDDVELTDVTAALANALERIASLEQDIQALVAALHSKRLIPGDSDCC